MQLVDFRNKEFSFKFEPKMWYKGGVCSNLDCAVCVSWRVMDFENLEKIGALPAINLKLEKLNGKNWKYVLNEYHGKVFTKKDQCPYSYTDDTYPYGRNKRTNKEIKEFHDRFQDMTLVQLTLYDPFTILGYVDIDACYYPMIWDPMKNIEHDSKWWVSRGRRFSEK